jgi:hypothetical protein
MHQRILVKEKVASIHKIIESLHKIMYKRMAAHSCQGVAAVAGSPWKTRLLKVNEYSFFSSDFLARRQPIERA